LLDLKGEDPLSDSFLGSVDNLNDLKAAIDGDTEAYNRLMDAAQEDIIANITINDDSFWTNKAAIEASLASLENSGLTDIEIDAELNSGPYIDALNQMIAATNMTADQVRNMLATLGDTGYDAVITEAPPKQTTTSTDNQYWQPAVYSAGDPISTGGE